MPANVAPTPQPGLLHRDQFTATVIANIPLCREHFKLVLRVAEAFPKTEPGQFVQLACREPRADYSPETEFEWAEGQTLGIEGQELMSPLAFLRRPFSLAGRRDVSGGVELDVIHRVVGIGTDWLARLRVGDAVGVLGPLGNRFEVPAAGQQAILVGGGVGIPPMLYLAEKLAGRDAVAFCGALTRELLPLTVVDGVAQPGEGDATPHATIEEFSRHGVDAVISTDDGSFGFRGFVTQALEKYLDQRRITGGPAPVIYTCGPEPMMKRVADIAAARGLECQIAVERAMACGMGTCQSCCIRLKRDPKRDGRAFAGKDWIYKLACTDGPVFRGADLLW
jgi:dihydroorotate dehydrogenase electron transfer subunit